MSSVSTVHGWPDMLRLMLGLGTALLYLSLPFTPLRGLPLSWPMRITGSLFLITAALTNISIGLGFSRQGWMLISDLIKFVSLGLFAMSLAHMVGQVTERRRRLAELEAAAAPDVVDPGPS